MEFFRTGVFTSPLTPAMFPYSYLQATVHIESRIPCFNTQHGCMSKIKSSAAWALLFSHLKVWLQEFWGCQKYWPEMLSAYRRCTAKNRPLQSSGHLKLHVISHLSQLSKMSLDNYEHFCGNIALMCGSFSAKFLTQWLLRPFEGAHFRFDNGGNTCLLWPTFCTCQNPIGRLKQ